MSGPAIAKGALVLSTDAAQLQSGLAKAQEHIAGFGHSLEGVHHLLSFHVGMEVFEKLKGAFEGVVGFFKDAGARASNTKLMSEAFGVGAEELQAYSGAARMAGVDTEQFTAILRVAADAAGEASAGGEDITKKLRAIGLSTADIAGQSGLDALNIMMDAIKVIANKSEQVKATGDIFGGRGAVAVMRLANSELSDTAQHLKDINAISTDHVIKQLESMNTQIELMEMKAQAAKDKAAANIAGGVGERITFHPDKMIDDLAAAANAVGVGIVKAFDAVREFFSGDDFLANTKVTVKDTAAIAAASAAAQEKADQDHWDKLSREMDVANRIAEVQAKARIDKIIRDEELVKLEKAKQHLDDIVAASGKVIAADPFADLSNAIEGLDRQLQFGRITFEQYDAGIIKAYDSLKKMAGIGNEVKLPSAVMAGSVEDINSRIQARADLQFGGTGNQMSQIENVFKAQAENNKRLADELRNGPLREIIKALDPLQQLESV